MPHRNCSFCTVFKLCMKQILLAFVVALWGRETALWAAVETTGGTPASSSQQVLIEAVVLEVVPGGAKTGPPRSHGASLAAGSHATVLDLSAGAANGEPRGFSYVWKLDRDFDATVAAFARDPAVKILQRPRIQTSHAVPATLFVGESQPDLHRLPGVGGPDSAHGQFPVGLTLEVNPLIGTNQLISLDLRLRVDRVEKEAVVKNVGLVPVVSSWEAQTRIALHDRDIVLLGGLAGWRSRAPLSTLRFPKDILGSESLFTRPQDALGPSELTVLIRPVLLAQ